MLGVMMFLSFLVPLIGALAIRRYAWIGIWAGLSTVVAVPVLLKLYNHTYDPMGWGFVFVLFFLPAAVGSSIGIHFGPSTLTARRPKPPVESSMSSWQLR